MYKDRKTPIDKLNALLFRPEASAAKGSPFPEVYPGDFCSELPSAQYLGTEKQPMPEGRVYDVREYGAVPNDRQRLATLGINYAISLCSRKGGGVVLLSGGDYYCQTIVIKSNVTLFIESGSRLIASHDVGGYHHHALLYCAGAEHVTITGGGKICGEGNHFSHKPANIPSTLPASVIDIGELHRTYREQLRSGHPSNYGFLLSFTGCWDIQLHHIMLENAADWTCRIHLCDQIAIHHLVIHNNRHIANTDGIVLVGSSHVTIEKCFISTGADGICLKNALWMDCRSPMGHIQVKDCEIITHTCAFKIGSATTADIFNVLVENCYFHMTDVYPGMMCGVSIAACDGAMVCDVTLRNLSMDRVVCPLFIQVNDRNRAAETELAKLPDWAKPKDALLPADPARFGWKSGIRRVTAQRIVAKDIEMPVIIAGLHDLRKGTKYAEHITLSDFDLSYRKCKEVYDRRLFIPEYGKDYPQSWRFRNLPSYGLWARHVKGLSVSRFTCAAAKSTWKQCFSYEDIK